MKMETTLIALAVLGISAVLTGCGDDPAAPPAPYITVTSPNGGEIAYYDGDDFEITWSSHGVTDVDLYYSTAGAGGPWTPINAAVANTGSYAWSTPSVPSGTCFVRVEEAGGVGPTDDSDGAFTLSPATILLTAPSGAQVWRVGETQTISWSAIGISNVRLDRSLNGSTGWSSIEPSLETSLGTYQWDVTGPARATWWIRVADANDESPASVSASSVSIIEVIVGNPNGGEQLYYGGTDATIMWTAWGGFSPILVDVYYSIDNGQSWLPVATNVSSPMTTDFPDWGEYTWLVPDVLSSECLVRVSESGAGTAEDVSNAVFSIDTATVSVTAPTGGETWQQFTDHTVSWTGVPAASIVAIQVSRDGGPFQSIASSIPASDGSYTWNITQLPAANCVIRVSDQNDWGNSGVSPSFTIAPLFAQAYSFSAFSVCDAAWVDYDSDGDLDLVVNGHIGTTSSARILTNSGSPNYTLTETTPSDVGVNYNSRIACGDYDGNGFVDLLVTGSSGTQFYSNSSGSFTNVTPAGVSRSQGAVAWADWDADGDLDALCLGRDSTFDIAEGDIFNWNGSSFVDSGAAPLAMEWAAAAWGDLDGDGIQDLALLGDTDGTNGTTENSILYSNSGGALAGSGQSLVAGWRGDLEWGDYDNDGDLDLVLMYAYTTAVNESIIYENSAGTLSDSGILISDRLWSSAAWGDYDGDGDLDLLTTGMPFTTGASYTTLYENTGTGFSVRNVGLPAVSRGAGVWADYDEDGDLDIALAGNGILRIYRNDHPGAGNTPPSAPVTPTLTRSVDAGTGAVTFTWNDFTDAQTPSAGLSYNLKVVASSDSHEAVPGMALADGERLVVARGPFQPGASTNEVTITLPSGDYTWAVQAVDTSFAGSAWVSGTGFTVSVP